MTRGGLEPGRRRNDLCLSLSFHQGTTAAIAANAPASAPRNTPAGNHTGGVMRASTPVPLASMTTRSPAFGPPRSLASLASLLMESVTPPPTLKNAVRGVPC